MVHLHRVLRQLGSFFLLLAFGGRQLAWTFGALVRGSVCLMSGTGGGRLERADTIVHVQVSLIRTSLGFFTGALLYQLTRRLRIGGALPRWGFDE